MMSDKKRNIKISDGGPHLICDVEVGLEEIRMICDEMAVGEKWTFEIVEMTEEEVEALPEHMGW